MYDFEKLNVYIYIYLTLANSQYFFNALIHINVNIILDIIHIDKFLNNKI